MPLFAEESLLLYNNVITQNFKHFTLLVAGILTLKFYGGTGDTTINRFKYEKRSNDFKLRFCVGLLNVYYDLGIPPSIYACSFKIWSLNYYLT